MLRLAMNQTTEAEPSAEYPKPGVAENINGALTMIDGALIFVTLMANRGDLAALALFGLVAGSAACLKMVESRYEQAGKSQRPAAGNDFWEVPASA